MFPVPLSWFRGDKRPTVAVPAGFTLIEVLVSMAILAICLTVIMELFSGGLNSGRLSEEYIRAVFVAREKMEEILVREELAPGEEEGEDAGYRWLVKVGLEKEDDEEAALTKLPFALFSIEVSVRWRVGERPKDMTLRTLKLARELTEQES